MNRFSFTAACCFLAIQFFGVVDLLGQGRRLDFNRDVRPILSDNCFHCHGPDAGHREADLRLDDVSARSIIVADDPSDSELILRILEEDPDLRMPPEESGKHLTAQQIETLRQWISEGAEYQAYWAYQSPTRHAVGKVADPLWPDGRIDQFIGSRYLDEQLQPAPDADRKTLARRLSFDLTGLPPDVDDVARFVSDRRADAYGRYVDELLSAPGYGERMAMYWLDLVRYADTVGYHGDQDHSISPYRDYVVDAFNHSMPFDTFTREQLAGDLLPEAGQRQKVATGYNRLLQTSHEGGVQPREYLAIYAADRIRNLSAVWMGATIGCAQCHDHKYDPYTIKDFYSLVAFFADVDESQHFKTGSNALPTRREPEIIVLSEWQREAVDELEREIEKISKQGGTKKRIESLRKRIAAIQKNGRRTMVTASIEHREIRVLPRGNWLDDSGEVVQPAIPEFMRPIRSAGPRASRLDLANWLVDDQAVGGLTARVMVNRLWYLLFGVGISSSLDDFGGQGQPPEHPELLDHLSLEFMESGWDIKHLVRRIVMSRAYRQSSIASESMRRRDPYNRLYARQSRQRMSAEMIRDNALAVSGLLVRQQGGMSVKPYQPAGYYRHLNFPKRTYLPSRDFQQWRRGLYVHWQRQFLHPMLKAFDAPSREECTAQRPLSNTPLAALALLNDPTFVEASRMFAQRIILEGGNSDHEKLSFAFMQALFRAPDEREQTILLGLLSASRDEFSSESDAATEFMGVGMAPLREGIDLSQLAAWTMVSRAILNLDESITRQ